MTDFVFTLQRIKRLKAHTVHFGIRHESNLCPTSGRSRTSGENTNKQAGKQ